MDRRTFLSLAGATAGSIALPRLAVAQPKPLVYYSINAFSGNFAASGKYSDLGVRAAIAAYGSRLGRAIEYKRIDTEGNPAIAVRKVQQAISQDGARHFGGAALSSEALAVMKEVNKANGVYITYVGADEVTGKDCNRSTFRWSTPTFGAVNTVLRPLFQQNPKWKKAYTITGQYVFGEALLRNSKAVMQDAKVELVGNSYHSLAEKEFSGYLGNAMGSGADVLVILNFGANTLDLLRQAASFGIKKRMAVAVVWFSGLDTFQALGADVTEDIYFGLQYWHGLDTPGNKTFLDVYRREFKENPRFYSAADYQIATLMFDAIRKGGSEDPAAIIKALEGYTYAGLTGEEQVRPFDHQVIKNYFLARGKKKSAMKDADDFVDILSSSKTASPKSASDCKMA
ncbi:branched-chain amino acid ABC transport system permease protein (plasmid) [Cupriavidus necator N-1]|uniref:Branched-chain amino acid ABC transport system permease protein n=1 Tax=Cupriavidus necator (strain ATCC 43291 / DSM 13513 / CCUG 52238 / LMG 8453 / N-1) TaxID=1042878 RepID=F8GX92_CUPNN|nr:ABC transporter substrate-binding protein [Cupriavidus necator]AEI81962.1 branched-chain amino acid ABC transport system permease protein [Cupriavidus necator N-1]MDX6008281.1 ABC transporter substrate-binding protein [Cupriavidus necator]